MADNPEKDYSCAELICRSLNELFNVIDRDFAAVRNGTDIRITRWLDSEGRLTPVLDKRHFSCLYVVCPTDSNVLCICRPHDVQWYTTPTTTEYMVIKYMDANDPSFTVEQLRDAIMDEIYTPASPTAEPG